MTARKIAIWVGCLCVVVLLAPIIWLACIQVEVQAAIQQWSKAGGSVSVQLNTRLGPDHMSIGTAPGKKFAQDFFAIRDAVMRLNRWPRCRKIYMGGFTISHDQWKSLLDPLELELIHIQDTPLDPETVEYLAERKDLICIRVGGELTSRDIRRLLEAHPKRRVDISRIPMTADEKSSLLREFDGRLFIY